MRKNLGYISLIIVFISGILSAIFPHPFYSTSGNITPPAQMIINDYYENETNFEFLNNKFRVLNLDWEIVNDIFENYVDSQIIDIETKESFIIQRTGGINHADIEPINTDNTNKLLKITKNSPNNRRAVWIKINNMWFGASLYSIPHGYGLISDNNMNGHLCLHFLNSKTDGTKKVDLSHQKEISYALKHEKELERILKN